MFKRKNKKHPNNKGVVAMHTPFTVSSEEFRTVRTNIQFSMVDKALNTILVTSSVSNEGKSTIASNLAAVFASQGSRVLLVDADLRKPTLHLKFSLPNRFGLTSFLIGAEPKLSIIFEPNYERNFHILTSGLLPPNPSELLASQRMTTLIEKLNKHFDLIIFDGPPLNVVTDSQVLASQMDGVVFVVKNGVAERDKLIKSKGLLEKVHANVIGTIFNFKKEKEDNDYTLYGIGDKMHS